MKCERIKIGNIHTNFTKEWIKIGRILTCQNHSLTYATHIFISEVSNQGRARVNKGWVNTGFCLGIHVVLMEPMGSQSYPRDRASGTIHTYQHPPSPWSKWQTQKWAPKPRHSHQRGSRLCLDVWDKVLFYSSGKWELKSLLLSRGKPEDN